LFRGSFKYNLDAKGRISIPAKLRKHVPPEAGDTFIITKGNNKCIDLFPQNEWQQIENQILQKNPNDPGVSAYSRMLLEFTTDDTMDSQSRILLPQQLLEYANIEKEVLILGVLRKIELWNPILFEEYKKQEEKNYEQFAAEVMAR
jgi:MraZ protein